MTNITKLILGIVLLVPTALVAQTSTDLVIMPGLNTPRPTTTPKFNFDVALGHKFQGSGNEVTFGYTYANEGSGFSFSNRALNTEALGFMKTVSVSKSVGLYGWGRAGVTELVGVRNTEVRPYLGASVGLDFKVANKQSIRLQETFNEVVTAPWYTTTSLGYVVSW
jgi:hypothetical protein